MWLQVTPQPSAALSVATPRYLHLYSYPVCVSETIFIFYYLIISLKIILAELQLQDHTPNTPLLIQSQSCFCNKLKLRPIISTEIFQDFDSPPLANRLPNCSTSTSPFLHNLHKNTVLISNTGCQLLIWLVYLISKKVCQVFGQSQYPPTTHFAMPVLSYVAAHTSHQLSSQFYSPRTPVSSLHRQFWQEMLQP